MLIKIEGLGKKFINDGLETEVLRDIDFTIDQGEFVAIMGPSGSGKSTLMHIMGLLDRATAGKYYLEGHDVSGLDDEALARLRNKKIGFVFQAFNLLPRTTVLENVKLPLTYADDKSHADTKAKKVLEAVGLGHRLHYFTNQISGGEKQRVAIARALVNGPSVIFADEPTGNLDSKSGTQILQILQKLNKDGNTIILVTHEIFTAEHAKRIIKVRDGEIISDELVSHRRFASETELIK